MNQQHRTNKLAKIIADQIEQSSLDQSNLTREVLYARTRLTTLVEDEEELDPGLDLSQNIWSFKYKSGSSGQLSPQLGYSADDIFGFALLVKNEGMPFVLSQGSYLDDDLVLTDTLIQYSPPRLKLHDVVKGELLTLTKEIEIVVSPQLIEVYISQFTTHLGSNKSPSIRTDRSSLPMEVIIFEEPIQTIAGDLFGPIYITSQDRLDTLVVSGNITFTEDSHIDKPLVLISGMDVFLKDSLTATDLVVYSEGGIYLEGSSTAQGTFYSEKQILVTDNSQVLFPSNLIVPKNDVKIYGQPEIGIVMNASVSGFVCVYDTEDSTPTEARYSLSAKVKKDRSAKLFGGIYCDGSVEAYGTIAGFVRCDRFEQVIKRTRWVNYLQDIQILRKSIGPDFPLPPIFNNPNLIKVLRVEYL